MKKLRKISLENFDRLSNTDASSLVGGEGGPSMTLPPPPGGTGVTISQPTTPPPYSVSVGPGGVGGSYDGGKWTGGGNTGPGNGSVSWGIKI